MQKKARKGNKGFEDDYLYLWINKKSKLNQCPFSVPCGNGNWVVGCQPYILVYTRKNGYLKTYKHYRDRVSMYKKHPKKNLKKTNTIAFIKLTKVKTNMVGSSLGKSNPGLSIFESK